MPQYITMRELNAKAQELGTVGEALKWAKANGYEVDTGSDFAVLPPEEGDELPPVSNQTTANTLAVMPDQQADTEEGTLAVPTAGEKAPAATGPLSEMDALRAEIKGLPEKQKLAYDQIFRQGQDYISKMYPTPTRSQLLSSMSRALLSPTKYRGFAGTMYNMASGLEEIDKSREEAMRKRMEAEQKLQQTLALAGTGDTAKALQLRYQLLKEEGDRQAAANKPQWARTEDPVTGEITLTPVYANSQQASSDIDPADLKTLFTNPTKLPLPRLIELFNGRYGAGRAEKLLGVK